MLQEQQRAFAERFGPEEFAAFRSELERRVGAPIEFKVFEAPVFVSHTFRQRLEQAAIALVEECVTPDNLRAFKGALEERYTVANQDEKPLFSVVDFAVTQDSDGEYQPKLIELQGFPSLYGYQFLYGETVKDFYRLDAAYRHTLASMSSDEYKRHLRNAILGGHKPENVAILEVHPETQKTRPDFLALQQYTGAEASNIFSVRKEGRTLLHQRNGAWLPIHRIVNRAIVDEIDDLPETMPFAWNDDLEVEWAGHPNWYFCISKYSLPYLRHPSVPQSRRLDELDAIPDDLQNYVLKPLYSFAGKGVNVVPQREDVLRAQQQDPHNYVLQEKVRYAECVYTPEGMNKLELRLLMLWLPEWRRPQPVVSLIRTGRGPMMGVRYNSVSWSGSSACLFA